MQSNYLDLISDVIENTKGMMGATDSALGDERAHNTSAILTLQSAASVSLEHVRVHFCRCIGELAKIWADMLCAYCPAQRMLAVLEQNGKIGAQTLDYELLKNAILSATVHAGKVDRYSPASTVSTLDKLLESGHLSVAEYVELLPSGVLVNREALLEKIKQKGVATDE